MAGDDLGERVAQIGLRIETFHLAGLDTRGNDDPMPAAAVRSGAIYFAFAARRQLLGMTRPFGKQQPAAPRQW
jgi:hypothetical protein